MKKIILSLATLMAIESKGQFVINNIAPNNWVGLSPTGGFGAMRSVGFGGGFAGLGGLPQSRFQINDFNWLYPANGTVVTGSLFRTDGNTANLNQWQFFTGTNGNSSNEKYKLYIPANSSNVGHQSTRGDMFFNTASANFASGGTAERMRLTQGTGGNLTGLFNRPGVTKIQISHDGWGAAYLPPAVAMLNVGTSFNGASAGNRNWMDIGTYYAMNTDNMYIGLKDGGANNQTNAVINWGDDAAQPNTNNRLVFNFTGFPGQGQSSTNDGLEIGRMWASSNAGRMGIGGDPMINNYFPIPTDPNNTLEINSPATFVPNIVGSSGLRFTDLRSASTPQANPGQGVLSVDANGDVIYVPGGGGSITANNGISVNATGVVQLGVPCNLPSGFPNLAGIVATQLTTDRVFANRNQNFWIASLDSETGGVGIGGQPVLPFCGTGNTFEVSANSKNTDYGSANASGMRFTKLTALSPTIPNGQFGVNSSKVLTVDDDGDVVLTDAVAASALGNICGATPQNPLSNNWEIPMAGFNFNFINPVNSQSSFHIGNQSCATTVGRLNVYNDNLQVGGAFSSILNSATNSFGIFSTVNNSGTGNIVSVQGTANSTGTGAAARGVRGEAIAANGSIAEGVKGIANSNNNCSQNIAVGGLSANGALISIAGDFDVEQSNSPNNEGINIEVINGTSATARNVGINATANSIGGNNFGGIFVANGATNNYAVFAQAPITAVQTPGGTAPLAGNYAGYFNGDVVRTGTDNFTSDANLKQNIDTITNALSIINQLKPKSYDYKQSSFPSMSLPSGKQYGLIAQDVQLILPELVNNNVHPAKVDSVGNVIVPAFNYLSLEYQQLTGIMIKAIQEQQRKIESLTQQLNSKDSVQDARLAALEAAIMQCCSSNSARTSNSNINQLDIELSDKNAIVLNQNVPNPFAEQTTITYNVPESVIKAQIIFYNNAGQIIQTVDVTTRGKGKVNVFASDLSSGLYHYTLVADGKVVASKKMVRE